MHHISSFRITSLLLRATLALLLSIGIAPAWAGPQFHVTIDTAALAGQDGYLDFLFLGLSNATPAHATISGLSGDFAADGFASGEAAGSVGAGIGIGNGGDWNEFGQWAHFGGLFSFDIGFDVEPGPGAGSTLSVALLNGDFGYLGTPGDVATFTLNGDGALALTFDAGIAAVNAVPEPSTVLLGGAGLLLMGAARRRSRRV